MASGKIKGITIEIGGDTTKLGKAIADSEKQSRSLQGELKQVEKLLKFDPGNTELLAQKQKILTEAVAETTKKLKTLKDAEEQVIEQFNRGDIGEDQLRAFQREIIKTQSELDDFDAKLNGTEENLEDVGDSAEQSSDGFTIMKGALADLVANAISSAISAIGDFIGALLDLSEATEEYRTMQSKLEGSAKTFGYSTEYAKSKYEEFYKYLGDDQMATNAITNLMGLGTSTESVSALAEGATAVWASYGDSIPIESLTESINETITVGKVTGTMADTINWAKDANVNLEKALGGNKKAQKAYNDALKEGLPVEDAFNEALAKITDEQERADVVAQFLNSTYGESKKTYDELNKSVTDANEAELELKDTQAQLGETMAPVNNALTDMKNQALEAITPLVEKLADGFVKLYEWLQKNPAVMKTLVAVAIALATAFTILAGALAIQGIITGVTKAIAFLNTTLLANPIVLIVALIAGLVAGFIYLWNNCEGFRNFWINLWEKIKEVASVVKDALVEFFTVTIPNAWTSFITKTGELVTSVVNWFKSLPEKISSAIQGAIERVKNWAENLKTSASNGAKNCVNAVVNFFKTLPNKIGYAIGFVIGKLILWSVNIISWILTNVPKIITSIVNFFKQLPSKIWTWLVNVVTNIATWGSNMWVTATSAVSNLITSVISWFTQLPGRIWSAIIGAVERVGAWGANMKSRAVSAISSMVSSVYNTAVSIPGRIYSAIQGAISRVKSWGSSLASTAGNAIRTMSNKMLSIARSIPAKFVSIGRDIIEGIKSGISGAIGGLYSSIKSSLSGLVSKAKEALGINSPSKVFANIVGKAIPEGIAKGVTDNTELADDAVLGMTDDLTKDALNINGATINRKLTTTFTGGSLNNVVDNASLLGKLNDIYDRLGRLQMVTDTGALVGEMLDKIDAGLANKQLLSARGV